MLEGRLGVNTTANMGLPYAEAVEESMHRKTRSRFAA